MPAASAALVSLLLGAYAGPPIEDLPLEMTPRQSTVDVAMGAARLFGNRRVTLADFADARESSWHIGVSQGGMNTKDRGRKLTVSTRSNVPDFCQAQLASLLRRGGVPVVTEGGDLVISGEVERFFVDEGDDYVGTVVLNLKVADAAGKVLWEGKATGMATNWGRSFKAENYLETLSDALLNSFSSFVHTTALADALDRPAGAAAPR